MVIVENVRNKARDVSDSLHAEWQRFRIAYPLIEGVATAVAVGFVPVVGVALGSLEQARDAVVEMRRTAPDQTVSKLKTAWLVTGLVVPIALTFVNPLAGAAAYGVVRGIRARQEFKRAEDEGRVVVAPQRFRRVTN